MKIIETNIKDALLAEISGELNSVDLLKASLEVIKEKNKDIHAYLEVFDDAKIDGANKAKVGKALYGIPIAIKDNILIEGKISSASSRILENHKAIYDATVIKKLKEAGAVFVGRTNCDEFAMGSSTENSAYGVTKNPLDDTRVPGGSSGGSAASVAMGSVYVALGSDTGGSIRQPASFCGLVGLKPTYGAVSRYGLIALGSSLDCIGSFGKSVSDVEIVHNIIKGKDKMDSTTVDEEDFPKREMVGKKGVIGVPHHILKLPGIDKDVISNFEDSIKRMEGLGYLIKEIELPSVEYSLAVYYIILPAEASSNLARFDGVRYGYHKDGENLLQDYLNTRAEGFGVEARRRIILGTYVLSAGYYDAYYGKATLARRKITDEFLEAFEKVDFVAMPTTPTPAFKIGEKSKDPLAMYASDIFTVPANIAKIPAISLPSGNVERDGVSLPLGFQLMAPHMKEDWLFSAGKDFLGEK
ncbi:MAG: Asp-tRNA(Asn)/Glu-tRNA(Gln) amidotransferase subunit GatA [Patescibacteria group bacterium]